MTKVASVLCVVAVAALGALGCGDKDTKLKVTGMDPEKGDIEGGYYVKIYGNRFIDDGPRNAKVFFGTNCPGGTAGQCKQGTVVRFAKDDEMIVEPPGGKPNEVVDVLVVFDPGGEKLLKKAFTYVEKVQQPSPDFREKK
jgi:hypothetical protein